VSIFSYSFFGLLTYLPPIYSKYRYNRLSKSVLYKILFVGAVVVLVVSLIVSFGFLYVSSRNYAGAEAFNVLHENEKGFNYGNFHFSFFLTNILI